MRFLVAAMVAAWVVIAWSAGSVQAQPPVVPTPTPSPTATGAATPTPGPSESPIPRPSASAQPSASPTGGANGSSVRPSVFIQMLGGGSREGQMPYSRFVDGATEQNGLFTVWRKSGRVYFEIAPDQLEHTYLLVPMLASGLGKGLFAGLHFSPVLWSFRKVDDQILSLEQNPYGKAQPKTPAALSVADAFPPSVIASNSITAINPDNGHIVFPADALFYDIVDLSDIISYVGSGFGRSLSHYGINSALSYYGPTKAFPKNVDVELDLTMSSGSGGPFDTVPDSRSLFVKLHYSIIDMPDDGYRPRLADDRVGYFVTARRQYDDYQGPTSFVRYIRRWNLRKSDPRARVSPAKNPIVFYLSNDIPVRYRPAITRALLTWNSAFAAAGISNAIKVRQQPDDPNWDPDDVRYSVVRWIVSTDPVFAAYGPAFANPLTGEIFRGDIVIDGDIMRSAQRHLEDVVDPTKAMTPSQRLGCSLSDCDYGLQLADQAQWASLAMQSEGLFRDPDRIPDWFVNSYLTEAVLHESGHTLGLRHNFESSTIYSLKEIHDRRFTQTHGLVGSVMDYVPINLSPHGQPQGTFFQTVLGPWDYYTIKYGYEQIAAETPDQELPELQRLAAQSTRPELRYATDEDSSWLDGFATDPRVNEFDLSDDPLGYASDVLKIDQRLFTTLPSRLPAKGRSYSDLRSAFMVLMRSWYHGSQFATHYIGGEYFSRAHRGDPNAQLPFTPVSRAKQKEAFDLLDRYAFSDNAFSFSPALINSLGDDRFAHWQSDPNEFPRLDFPLDEFVEAYQAGLLLQMWQPNVLSRLAGLESRVSHPGDTMSLADLYDWTDASIWRDTAPPNLRNVPRAHRALQHLYAELLIHIMLKPDLNMPNDARTLARHHLVWLRDRLSSVLARGHLDEATVANYEDVRTLTQQALSAAVQLPTW